MADNTILNTGSGGDTIRTDDNAGVKTPISKIELGADGVFSEGLVGSANPMPVIATTGSAVIGAVTQSGTWNVTNVSGTISLPTGAATAALQSTGNTSLATIAGDTTSIDGKITACNTGAVVISSGTVTTVSTVTNLAQLGGTAIAMGTGIRTAGTQRVTIATDDVVPASQSGTWNITNVSGTISLPTGAATAALQTSGNSSLTTIAGAVSGTEMQVDVVAALPAGTNNIGDVDVLTVPAPLNVVGGGTEAAAQRVTIASDSTGVLTVDDGGGALTVDWAGTAPPIGAGVEATALRVTVATDSTGVLSVDDNSASLTVDVPAVATGGATPGKLISAATTNATSVKGSAGTLYMLTVFSTNAAARYAKFYNKATAPTVGTDIPVLVFTVPGNTAGSGFVVPIPSQGIAFSTGIAFALTTGAADNDTGAVALNEIVVSYAYN